MQENYFKFINKWASIWRLLCPISKLDSRSRLKRFIKTIKHIRSPVTGPDSNRYTIQLGKEQWTGLANENKGNRLKKELSKMDLKERIRV